MCMIAKKTNTNACPSAILRWERLNVHAPDKNWIISESVKLLTNFANLLPPYALQPLPLVPNTLYVDFLLFKWAKIFNFPNKMDMFQHYSLHFKPRNAEPQFSDPLLAQICPQWGVLASIRTLIIDFMNHFSIPVMEHHSCILNFDITNPTQQIILSNLCEIAHFLILWCTACVTCLASWNWHMCY